MSLCLPWKLFFRCLLTVSIAATWGCSGRPARIKPPRISPTSAASAAMAKYDTNHDQVLSAQELEACPGMRRSVGAYDLDGNGKISESEIVERLRQLTQFKTALTPLRVIVMLNGKPLEGAEVRLIPEEYLGSEIKGAKGITNAGGSASPRISEEELPERQRQYHGIHYGTYRVEITHAEMAIPEKYNTKTTLGYETIVGDPMLTLELEK
jgi:hypothetical protein